MARINIDTAELYDHGQALGFIFGAYIRGLLDGMQEFSEAEAEVAEKAKEEADGLCRAKQENGDCAACFCDRCINLEQCANIRDGEIPDGIRPFPCVGCIEGMRFKPVEEEQCGGFEEKKAEQ